MHVVSTGKEITQSMSGHYLSSSARVPGNDSNSQTNIQVKKDKCYPFLVTETYSNKEKFTKIVFAVGLK